MELHPLSPHHSVLKRLIPAWLLLSLLLGAGAYRLEYTRVIDNAAELASEEVDRLDQGRHFDPELLGVFLGLAPDLYLRFNGAESEALKKHLAASVARYFPV